MAASGSSNVFCNGLAVHRVGDVNQIHTNDLNRCRGVHQTTLQSGSPNIFVNGKPLGRIGDNYQCLAKVAQGSPNVFAN